MSARTPGQRFRDAIAAEQPLQVIGAINANHALLAKRAGFQAIYLSGGGVAAGCVGGWRHGKAVMNWPFPRGREKGQRGSGVRGRCDNARNATNHRA